MNPNEDIASEIQKLDPSSIIEVFELDCTDLGGEIFRFHNGTNKLSQNLVWQGNEYIRFPIQVTGFEVSGQGQFPRPTVVVSNVMSAITIVMLQYGDLIGAKFTRKRTFLKYLDAINFPGNTNPTEDPLAYFPDDIFFVDRKAKEDREKVQFELASATDLQGVLVPKRTVIQSVCPWVYRSANCGYMGIPLYDDQNEELPLPVSAEALAMRSAWDDVIAAKANLVDKQALLDAASTAKTNAAIYSQNAQYNYSNGLAPKYYVSRVIPAGANLYYWNDVPVTPGTVYGSGAFQLTTFDGIYERNIYSIIQYTRDESALTAAIAAYDAAVIDRDAAQDSIVTYYSTFEDKLALVPSDDPVYSSDVCGKRLTSCKIRFATTDALSVNNPLPFGGFPGVGR